MEQNGKSPEKNEKSEVEGEDLHISVNKVATEDLGTDLSFKRTILWNYVVVNLAIQTGGVYGMYLMLSSHYLTIIWTVFLWVCAIEGITMGAHRLYAHRAYKGTPVLKAILIILQTLAGQFSLFTWVRDHRIHHRFTDTDADPHNANRGFFFSHLGWLMVKRHPLVLIKGKTIDMSDLRADKLVMFQKNNFHILYIIFAVLIPAAVPMYFWNETFKNAFFVACMARNFLSTHSISSVNSVAHFFGTKPYDKRLRAVESPFVAAISVGEGWHNYHHSFPWDYKAAELGSDFNLTQHLIELAAWLGLAYDLKTASRNVIEGKIRKSGDGTYKKLLTL